MNPPDAPEEKTKVVIAEDEAPLRNALLDRLSDEPDIEPIGAEDGLEALRILEKEQPALVLLDIAMPKRTGLSVYKDMKESNWGDKIKVIFLTNSTGLSEVAFTQQYGPVEYLVKADWGIEDIVQKVRDKLFG